jgi:hypothetical protein
MPGVVLVLGTLLTPPGWTQEKSKAPDETRSITPLKVQVVLSEFEGEKKISSLPYTFLVSADFVNDHAGRGRTSLRMGLRVPVTVSTKDSPAALQYIDVGTDLDCWAFTSEDGRFKLELVVERSSLYAAGPERKSVDWGPGDPPLSIQPIVRKFRVAFSLLVRDGQTVQSTAATDPITGRVQKVEVTATIAK